MSGADAPPAPPLAASVLATALAHAGVGIIVTDARRRVLYVNDAFTRHTGYTLADAVGRTCAFLQGPGTDPGDVAAIRAALDRAEGVDRVLLNYRKDGRPIWYRVRIQPIFEGGELRHFVGVQEDHTAVRELQARLEHAANSDGLTGLGNRRAFDAHLRRRAEDARPFGLIVLDVDDLKRVNDQGGHAAGDALLCAVAAALDEACGPGDRTFRLGGDEFAVVSGASHAAALRDLAARVRAAFSRAHPTPARLSVGAAVFPHDAPSVAQTLRLADGRMYACKARGKRAPGERAEAP